jgi:hypothetical protein
MRPLAIAAVVIAFGGVTTAQQAGGREETVEVLAGGAEGRLLRPSTARLPVVVLAATESGALRTQELAEALSRAGFASLRYDARFVPQPTEAVPDPDALQDASVDQAAAWIVRLRNDVRFTTITVAGIGDVAAVAMRAARAARADAVVTIGNRAAKTSPFELPLLRVDDDLRADKVEDASRDIASFIRRQRPARHPEVERRSLRELVTAGAGATRIAIEYGRPSKRGRDIWGALVPYTKWWMPGADEATTLTTGVPMTIGDLEVPAGDYTLYTEPKDTSFTLIINRATGVYHTVYHPDRDLGRVPMTMTKLAAPVEQVTFGLSLAEDGTGKLTLSWDDREYSVEVRVRGRRSVQGAIGERQMRGRRSVIEWGTDLRPLN